ncbi:hypothetical protein D3C80_1058640 [compost metagenome]
MAVGLEATEVQPRGDGDVLGLEEMPAEGVGIAAKGRDVGVQVEGALRLHGDAKAQRPQRRQQVVAAAGELGAARLEDRQGVRLETGQRGVLGHGRRTDVEVLRQLFQRRHGVLRRHQPAQPPAGHAEILGEAVEHIGLVVHLQHAGRIQTIGQPVVDLVHQQLAAARAKSAGQPRQLLAAEHAAGGIGRRGQQRADAVRVPVALDQFGSQLVVRLRPHRHQLRIALDQAQEVAVARVAGIGEQPVLARIHQQGAGQQQGATAAGSDEDALGVYAHSVTPGIEAGQRLAQRRQAARGGIAGMSGRQGGLTGTHDGLGGGEIRLADFQVDDVVAGGLQLVGTAQQGHDVKGFDGATARAEERSHAALRDQAKGDSSQLSPSMADTASAGLASARGFW